MKPIKEFLAVYNPYTRELLVKYGEAFTTHFFEEVEEWAKISYNADEEHPCYLHVQLDYDETMQLLFYPRVKDNESLHEDLGSYYNSEDQEEGNIVIVHTDREWDEALANHLELSGAILDIERKIKY